ncbi:hypothetical protein R9C00_11905 [Flammeovirgaceae bacterium SG7u.111]|nr:hypothetical protein [Flammeovirgaceae bacterium SG7u.132]WPO38157.1 hypothetical protein R9C00_11905 [Flammeovirgaceae bacterium SG7u.111]
MSDLSNVLVSYQDKKVLKVKRSGMNKEEILELSRNYLDEFSIKYSSVDILEYDHHYSDIHESIESDNIVTVSYKP